MCGIDVLVKEFERIPDALFSQVIATLKRQVTETTKSEEEHVGVKRRTDLDMIM